MIKIDSITMKEVRGIRDLNLDFGGNTFVVSGPNGSGKSGVVDAIEFCLTGEISRLAGMGTGKVSLQRHGPHVEHRDDPSAAEVTINLTLTDSGKAATITRNMNKPKELRVEPEEPDVRGAVEDLANHPELVLSRREVITLILAQPVERSNAIQTLLRLDRIGQIRSVLRTALTKTKSAHEQSTQNTRETLAALRRHLDIEVGSSENILGAVNARRASLGLAQLDDLSEQSKFDEGVDAGTAAPTFNKESAIRDVEALLEAIESQPTALTAELASLSADIAMIEADRDLLSLVQKESFLEKGLEYVDSQFCPLCDTEWSDVESLRAHIEANLSRSAAAGDLRKRILKNASEVAKALRATRGLTTPVIGLATSDAHGELAAVLTAWSEELEQAAGDMNTIEGVLGLKERLANDWSGVPKDALGLLQSMKGFLSAKPDQSAALSAQTFLVLAQDRYSGYIGARQKERAADAGHAAARSAASIYTEVSEKALSKMYVSVEADFSDFYGLVNSSDESGFSARFEQGAGKLDLAVQFYGKGMFPPGAYHSEGHQDGMGVCLYLALMKRLFGDGFTFAVLDDVVMSIDSGHRRQFCRLLHERFPNTQFIITTHDDVWAMQMRTDGLVTAKGNVRFDGWSVETGPIFEPVSEIWSRIEADLGRNDVSAAAGRLRRHLEYVSTELAEALAASIPYRGDASYDLGDLFSAVVGRQKDLLALAAASANSWNNDEARASVMELKNKRTAAIETYGGELWIVNKGVHYNEWANLSKADFEPVVEAAKDWIEQFQCGDPDCSSWIAPTSRKDPQVLRCRCGAVNLSLVKK